MASNLSLYSIPAAFGVAALPHFYAIGLVETSGSGLQWDNANPRNCLEKIKDKVPKNTFEKIQRAEAAQQNGFENLALFATSIIAGNMARLPVDTLHLHAGGYLASRLVYNFLYINIGNRNLSALRSVSYFTGVGFVFSLFIQAGMQLNGGKVW